MNQKPYIGAVVQYHDRFSGDSKLKAAIIVDVHDDRWVALKIFSNGGGERFASHVEYGTGWNYINALTTIETPTSWDGI